MIIWLLFPPHCPLIFCFLLKVALHEGLGRRAARLEERGYDGGRQCPKGRGSVNSASCLTTSRGRGGACPSEDAVLPLLLTMMTMMMMMLKIMMMMMMEVMRVVKKRRTINGGDGDADEADEAPGCPCVTSGARLPAVRHTMPA